MSNIHVSVVNTIDPHKLLKFLASSAFSLIASEFCSISKGYHSKSPSQFPELDQYLSVVSTIKRNNRHSKAGQPLKGRAKRVGRVQ